MKFLHLITVVTAFLISTTVNSQIKNSEVNANRKLSILSGLIQPIAFRGVNIAVTYFTPKWTYEYSHGMFLHYPRIVRKDKGLKSLYSQYSTGPGIGYRIKNNLDIRFEVKVHRYDAGLNNTQTITYTNLDAGFGIYSRKYIFRNKKRGWKPFFLEHSVRYWQNLYSTLDNKKFAYIDNAGKDRVHKPHNIGFFYNLSVGYTLGLKK